MNAYPGIHTHMLTHEFIILYNICLQFPLWHCRHSHPHLHPNLHPQPKVFERKTNKQTNKQSNQPTNQHIHSVIVFFLYRLSYSHRKYSTELNVCVLVHSNMHMVDDICVFVSMQCRNFIVSKLRLKK